MTASTLPERPVQAVPDRRLSIAEAMAAVQADIDAVKKDGQYADNRGTNYRFRGIDGVINAVGPAMRKHDVVCVPHKTKIEYRDVTTSNNKQMRECVAKVTYRFYGPAGDHISARVTGEALDTSDKGTAKAMSVALRICYLQTFSIPTDDPDPDTFRLERGQSERPEPEPETDPIWLNATEQAIRDADDQEALRRLWEAVKAKSDRREVAPADRKAISAAITARIADLPAAAPALEDASTPPDTFAEPRDTTPAPSAPAAADRPPFDFMAWQDTLAAATNVDTATNAMKTLQVAYSQGTASREQKAAGDRAYKHRLTQLSRPAAPAAGPASPIGGQA